jgi:hypothetical protein
VSQRSRFTQASWDTAFLDAEIGVLVHKSNSTRIDVGLADQESPHPDERPASPAAVEPSATRRDSRAITLPTTGPNNHRRSAGQAGEPL